MCNLDCSPPKLKFSCCVSVTYTIHTDLIIGFSYLEYFASPSLIIEAAFEVM